MQIDTGIPLFIIGFALSSITGLPNRYLERLFRGNQNNASVFNLVTGSIGLLLVIGDLPGFLKENGISFWWFFLPFGIAVAIWVTKSWEDRVHGRREAAWYWAFFGSMCSIIATIGGFVFFISLTLTIYG